MRCIAVGLFGLFSSLAHADAYDVDTVCATHPQEKPLKTLCTDPLLSSARQLERAYWTALASISTPQGYTDIRKDRLQWRASYIDCGTKPTDRQTGDCLTQAITKFGATLESKFSESMEDTVETDEVFDGAQKTLSSLNHQLAGQLDACRKNVLAQFGASSSTQKLSKALYQACYNKAFDYVDLLLSEQDDTALYLLKNSKITPEQVRAETKKRYGPAANKAFVLEKRAEQQTTK